MEYLRLKQDSLTTWATVSFLEGLSTIVSTTAIGQGPEVSLALPGSWVYHNPAYSFDSREAQAVITNLLPRRTGFIPISVWFVLWEVTLGLNVWECLRFSCKHLFTNSSWLYVIAAGCAWQLTLSLTLSLLMSYTHTHIYIYGAASKSRNLTSYIWTRFLLGILLLEPCISLIYAWKTNKHTNYSFSLLIMYSTSYLFRHYIAIIRELS
jgi:hypothetical protein